MFFEGCCLWSALQCVLGSVARKQCRLPGCCASAESVSCWPGLGEHLLAEAECREGLTNASWGKEASYGEQKKKAQIIELA